MIRDDNLEGKHLSATYSCSCHDAPRVWAYRVGGTWEEVDHPAPGPAGLPWVNEVKGPREGAGFRLMEVFGVHGSRMSLAVWVNDRHDRFLADLPFGIGPTWSIPTHTILVEGLPAMLEFLALVLPTLAASERLERAEEEWRRQVETLLGRKPQPPQQGRTPAARRV
jgi:hypothetical protein